MLYVIIFIGALWGLITLFSFREEDKYIKDLYKSARKATQPHHGSE